MLPRRGIFDYWFDREWRQRDDINELAAESSEAAYGVEVLRQQVAQLRPMVYELSATVAVLVKMLAETGNLDPKVLQYRIEAELDEHRHPKQPPVPEGSRMIGCSKCLRMVPAERTLMTGNGAVCDPRCPP